MMTVQNRAIFQRHTFNATVLDQKIRDLALEAHLTAQRDDLGAHRRDHAREAERADVRAADVEDFLGRTGAHEFAHDLATVELRILDLAVQLAVREQAGTALTELHVGLRCQDSLAPQTPGVLGASTHVPAALEHDWTITLLREDQRREQSARPEAHDDRTFSESSRG